jgi:hypothetical protein
VYFSRFFDEKSICTEPSKLDGNFGSRNSWKVWPNFENDKKNLTKNPWFPQLFCSPKNSFNQFPKPSRLSIPIPIKIKFISDK